jgi:hypothetical protein
MENAEYRLYRARPCTLSVARRRVGAVGVCSKGALGNDEDHLAGTGGPNGQTRALGEEDWRIEMEE